MSPLISGLPKSVLVPLFTFLYLEAEHESSPLVYLSSMERSGVLLTFTLVSILTPTELKQFEKNSPELNKKADDVKLIRIANLFMKGTQLIINLNAVCGFPIPLEKLGGHNFWQGSILQSLYAYLDGQTNMRKLLEVVRTSLKQMDTAQNSLRTSQQSSSPLHKFDLLIKTWTDLALCDKFDTIVVTNEYAYRNNNNM